MAKKKPITIDEETKIKTETFLNMLDSEMRYRSEMNVAETLFDWVDQVEFACPYIDNIVRNPKVFLINEEEVVKIEKAKKISVESVKDLAKNTHYIEKIDPVTQDIKPSKILIEHREETYNTYENRFIYTLLYHLFRFVREKEALISEFDMSKAKILEYAASTDTGNEKINIELKVSAREVPKDVDTTKFRDELNSIKARLKKIKAYFGGWQKSEFYQALERSRVSFVRPPIRKTNVILKNPNFQVAMKLWEYLNTYDDKDDDKKAPKKDLKTSGDDILKGILGDTFLANYLVLDSISASRKEQKEKIVKYAVFILQQQIKRVISVLLESGIEMSDEELLDMISIEIRDEKTKRVLDSSAVKEKFKGEIEEYLKKVGKYLR
ncbi:MAG TPA: DUF2357 domain-containing protein [Tenericutes bacterium]|nr:DUF2357 domain-containing protein [Mycoplasmatota bacterium]